MLFPSFSLNVILLRLCGLPCQYVLLRKYMSLSCQYIRRPRDPFQSSYFSHKSLTVVFTKATTVSSFLYHSAFHLSFSTRFQGPLSSSSVNFDIPLLEGFSKHWQLSLMQLEICSSLQQAQIGCDVLCCPQIIVRVIVNK